MLILIQVHVLGRGEQVDLLVDGVQAVPEHQVSLCLGNGLAGIAGGAIADGPLVHIPVGGGAEALELLDQIDHILTVVQIGCGLGRNGPQGEQADDEHQSHDHASEFSLHNDLLLYV